MWQFLRAKLFALALSTSKILVSNNESFQRVCCLPICKKWRTWREFKSGLPHKIFFGYNECAWLWGCYRLMVGWIDKVIFFFIEKTIFLFFFFKKKPEKTKPWIYSLNVRIIKRAAIFIDEQIFVSSTTRKPDSQNRPY